MGNDPNLNLARCALVERKKRMSGTIFTVFRKQGQTTYNNVIHVVIDFHKSLKGSFSEEEEEASKVLSLSGSRDLMD